MSSTFKLLCFIATGFFLCNWEVPTGSLGMPSKKAANERDVDLGVEAGGVEVEKDKVKGEAVEGDDEVTEFYGYSAEDCNPSTNSSAPTALHDYKRYFANDSLIGRPVPCTRDDKICFRHNLIYHPVSDKCVVLWEACRGNDRTVVNRTELEHGSGRLVSLCEQNEDTCSGYRMAYDGLCYRQTTVDDVICGSGGIVTRHILGGMECRSDPHTPISVHQPEEDGSCAIPDLLNSKRSPFLNDPYEHGYRKELKCSSEQAACFSDGDVFIPGYDGCHRLHSRGPCAEDHVVVLDLQAASEGRAEGTCVDGRGGCPKGYKRMTYDNECHESREIQLVVFKPTVSDAFGRYFAASDQSTDFHLSFQGNESCIIDAILDIAATEIPIDPFYPPCGLDDSGECNLYEVESDSPKPDFDKRK